jgi:hypothetical protein
MIARRRSFVPVAAALAIVSCAAPGSEEDASELEATSEALVEAEQLPAVEGAEVASESATLAAETCTALRTTKLKMRMQAREEEYDTYWDTPTHGTIKNQVVLCEAFVGQLLINVQTCKGSNGKWKPRKYAVDPTYGDLALVVMNGVLDAQPKNDESGYGLFLDTVSSEGVIFHGATCFEKPGTLRALDATDGLLYLPIPVAKAATNVGTYVSSKPLLKAPANQYRCIRLAKGSVNSIQRYTVNQTNGAVTWNSPSPSDHPYSSGVSTRAWTPLACQGWGYAEQSHPPRPAAT